MGIVPQVARRERPHVHCRQGVPVAEILASAAWEVKQLLDLAMEPEGALESFMTFINLHPTPSPSPLCGRLMKISNVMWQTLAKPTITTMNHIPLSNATLSWGYFKKKWWLSWSCLLFKCCACLFCCQGFTWPCDFPATIAQPDSQMTARLEVPWPGHGYGFCHGRSSETTATSYPKEILALWVAVVIGHLGYEALKSVVAEWTF